MSIRHILPESNFQTKDFIYLRRQAHFSPCKYSSPCIIPLKSLPGHTEKKKTLKHLKGEEKHLPFYLLFFIFPFYLLLTVPLKDYT